MVQLLYVAKNNNRKRRWTKPKHKYISKGTKRIFRYKTRRNERPIYGKEWEMAKRTKIDPQPKLRNTSHEVQYEFNNFTVAQLGDASKL